MRLSWTVGPACVVVQQRLEFPARDLAKETLAQDETERKILSTLGEMRAGPGFANVSYSDGRLLRLLAEAVNARRVVEIGTSTGESERDDSLRPRSPARPRTVAACRPSPDPQAPTISSAARTPADARVRSRKATARFYPQRRSARREGRRPSALRWIYATVAGHN